MNIKNNSGFSLIELMVSSAILTILGGGLLALLVVGTDSWQTYNAHILSQQQTRNAVAFLTRDIREADNIVLVQSSNNMNMAFNHPVTGNITYSWTTAPGTNANRLIRQTDTTTRIVAKNITAMNLINSTNSMTVNITATVLSDKGRSKSFQLVKKIKKR